MLDGKLCLWLSLPVALTLALGGSQLACLAALCGAALFMIFYSSGGRESLGEEDAAKQQRWASLFDADADSSAVSSLASRCGVQLQHLVERADVDLSRRELRDTEQDSRSLRSLASLNSKLAHLDLSHNDLGSATVIALVGAAPPSLARINLSHNALGPESGAHLAQLVKRLPALTALLVSGNNLGDQGGYEFTAALRRIDARRTLSRLAIANCGLGERTAAALAEALTHGAEKDAAANGGHPPLRVESLVAFGNPLISDSAAASLRVAWATAARGGALVLDQDMEADDVIDEPSVALGSSLDSSLGSSLGSSLDDAGGGVRRREPRIVQP